MLTAYRLLLYLAFPWVCLRLAWRGIKNPDYLRRIPERFGFSGPDISPQGIWIHAVSVGEVNAALPLVERLLSRWPTRPVTVTTMTTTGSDRVRATLGDRVSHTYLPYDYPGSVRRFLRRSKPMVGVVMETEIWPNLVTACANSGVPMIYANVRMSERSWRGYRRFLPLVQQVLSRIPRYAVQSDADAGRLLDLGAPAEAVSVTGSMKFDMQIPASVAEAGEALRRRLGWNRPVLVAASTHEGEEEILLDAFDALRKKIPGLLLVLVPRHPERFSAVERLCRREQFNPVLATEMGSNLDEASPVLVVNRMGELTKFIAASDVVFMAGSLVPIGGHNLLEAAALERPVVFGPHMFNFAEISTLFLSHGAGIQIENVEELVGVVSRLFEDAGMRDQYGVNGRRLVEQNRGALAKVETMIAEIVDQS